MLLRTGQRTVADIAARVHSVVDRAKRIARHCVLAVACALREREPIAFVADHSVHDPDLAHSGTAAAGSPEDVGVAQPDDDADVAAASAALPVDVAQRFRHLRGWTLPLVARQPCGPSFTANNGEGAVADLLASPMNDYLFIMTPKQASAD